MESWDEIRTAYQVARAGTVSGAAEVLGVHHATVIRHIDALEQRLGVKLFQRHARGYTATEAGADLLQVAQATDDQFTQLAGRIKGQGEGMTGDLVITSIAAFAPVIAPILAGLQAENRDLRVKFLTGERLFRLEYGEAHVAVRSGPKPDQPDNVVQPFLQFQHKLVASDTYIDRYGMPADAADLARHYFVGFDGESRAPFNRWLAALVPPDRIRFVADDTTTMTDAIVGGAGIGFLGAPWLQHRAKLREVLPAKPEWLAPVWLVTHVDLHRTHKVQAVLSALKAGAKDWVA
jgi:DNA-binding transcriptional LysR family regulator